MSAVAAAPAPSAPSLLTQARWAVSDSLMIAKRNLLVWMRVPAYLEAAEPRSRELYLRHGYADRADGPFRFPDGGPPMWPMWREPQPPAAG